MKPNEPENPFLLGVEEVAAALGTDLSAGLSAHEAQSRLLSWGPNELDKEKPIPGWRRFLAQFKDVLVVLLLVATAISTIIWAFEQEAALPYEAMAIFAVVLLNAALGYVQQARAEAALAALRAMTAAEASVIRDGVRRRIPARELVPGDLVVIEEGDAIPADGRVSESTSLKAAEAALTGESVPVSKDSRRLESAVGLGDRHNMVFSGTVATYGRGRAVVTSTGMRTEMGRIAGMLKQAAPETTPLQQELDRTGKLLGIAVAIIAAGMIATLLLVEDVRGAAAVLDVLILGVALAVAAVPEGLPAVVTAVLSIGVQRMAKRNAIVRHLAAVEALGSAGVVATDKTGTLTKNEMTVRKVVTAAGAVEVGGSGYSLEGELHREGGGSIEGAQAAELEFALLAAERANNAALEARGGRLTVLGDPTEGALLVAARKAGLTAEVLDGKYPRVAEVPFSSERKLMSTVHRDQARGGRLLAFTKGAPDVLLARCEREMVGSGQRELTPARRAQIMRANDALADEALRTLGVSFRELSDDAGVDLGGADESIEQGLVFVGLVGMNDPPRVEARQAVAKAKAAGVRPVMITGDHPRTASVIARELGISADERTLTGADLEKLSAEELAAAVTTTSVYARVNPAHKLRIVEAFKRGRVVVAMTGDGVNDAPALKAADIGVAMGITGTEVAKGASDIVLADDNFASIVAAVEEGRAIFANIRKFLRYLLSSNIGEVLTMFFGVVLADRLGLAGADTGAVVLPLLATQLLWVNMVSDGAPALALGVDPAEESLMRKPPRPAGEGVITGRMWAGIAFSGGIVAAGTLYSLDAAMPGGFVEGTGDLRYGQTMAFTTLVLFQMFNVLNSRSVSRSAFGGLWSNPWLWAGILLSGILQIAVVHIPALQVAFGTTSLAPGDWARCLVVSSSILWFWELKKLALRAFGR